MSFFEKIVKGAGKAIQILEEEANRVQYKQAQSSQQRIGGRTIQEWDRKWQRIGTLETVNLTPYNRYVGLYRAFLHGKLVYIGRAIEWNNGGFRKRLSDYRRESHSARKHSSGQLMYKHRHELQMEIMITGEGQTAADHARTLERIFIGKYNPPWNVQK